MLLRLNEIDLGFERGAPGDDKDGEAEAVGDAGDQQLREEEHEEGADAIEGGGVGVVEAVGALVVLVRHHLALGDREGVVSPGAGGGQGEEEGWEGRGAYGAASLLGADGEEEGEDVEENEEAAEREGGRTRGGEPGRGRRGDGEGGNEAAWASISQPWGRGGEGGIS